MDFDYAPAPESAAIAALKDRYLPFIDGTFVEGGGEDLESINPGTGEHLTTVSTVGAEDLDRAVAAARRAYEQVWGPMPPAERGLYLFRIARGIAERARELAVLETLDNGKPIRETRDFDVPTAAQHFFYHAGWADKLQHLGLGPDPRPLGVAGQVIPWNFPLLMAAWKIAPALAAGNTVVIKPAETTCLSILVLAEIMADAGLPPGVVNVVPGAGDIGSVLINHPGIDKVAFTGSTAVGRRIQRELAGTGRKLTLELGGKGAHIVFDDAAQDQAVEGIVNGIFFNAGQVCCAGSRLLVQEPIAEEFVERLKQRMETLRVDNPLDKNTDVGAINSPRQHQRITELVQAGVDEGATCWTSSYPLPQRGYYVAPTLLTEATASMRVTREEIFGPVLTVLTFRTPDEAVAKANNTPYGLSAGVWTEKGSRAMGMAAALKAGVIWDNTFNRFDPAASFGGYRESGFGREGGPSGLAAYLDADTEGVLASSRADQHEGVLASPRADQHEGALTGQAAQSQPALTDPRADHAQPALVTPTGATRRSIDAGDRHPHRALLSPGGGPGDASASPGADGDAVPADGNAQANGQGETATESPGHHPTGRKA
jgi:aldehyde dehydrogenase (NAD+)